MNKEKLKKFKKIFEAQRKSILFNDKIMREDFGVNADDRYDEIDQATTDIEQSMRMRLRNREVALSSRRSTRRSSASRKALSANATSAARTSNSAVSKLARRLLSASPARKSRSGRKCSRRGPRAQEVYAFSAKKSA